MTSTIAPTPPTSATAAGPASHATVLATVPDAPPAAARLDPGTIITGTVLGRDPQGLVLIRTDKGVLALATHANLPVGSTVSLEVRVAGTKLQLIVLSVEPPGGEPISLPGGPGSGAATSTLPNAGAPAAPPSPATILAALTGSSLVMATVVHSPHPIPTARSGTQAVDPGMAGTERPAPATAPLPAPLPATGVSSAAPPAGTPAPVPTSTSPSGHAAPQLLASVTPGGDVAAGPLAATSPGRAAMPPPVQSETAIQPTATQPLGRPPLAPASPPTVPPPANGAATASQLTMMARAMAGQPAPASQPSPLPVGAEIGLRILGAALPGDLIPAMPARPPGAPPLTGGVVVAETPAGHPVIDTPAGRLVLAAKAALPAGTALVLEFPPSFATATGKVPSAGAPDQAMLRLSQGWSSLAEALATLNEAQDPAATALIAKLPQTGPRLAAGLVTLMTHLASGEIGELLGPALREALERVGRRDLTDRLRGEFQQLSRLASEPGGGDWRVMFLPFQHGQELHQMNLYLRGKRRGAGGEALDSGTRFIVEVDMTRLGPLQLDGLVHNRRFDLMLRSRSILPPSMQRDIEAIFDEARALGGYNGTIGFQVAASFPVAPLEQAKRKCAASGLVV